MKALFITILTAVLLCSCVTVKGPIGVTSNPIGSKKGEASRTIVLGLAFGHTDLSLKTAAKNGNITKISTVDYVVEKKFFTKKVSTVVTGE